MDRKFDMLANQSALQSQDPTEDLGFDFGIEAMIIELVDL